MSQRPTPARKDHLHRLRRRAGGRVETRRKSELFGGAAQQTCRWLGQQSFTGAIDELQSLLAVESEDRDVDFSHDGAQERRGFHRAESLFAQCLAQVVHFQHHFAERVARERTPPANRVVTFANGGKNVGKRLQRTDDAGLEIEGDAEPQQSEQQIDRSTAPGRSSRRTRAEKHTKRPRGNRRAARGS